jgi:hypothetical protein
MAKVTSKAPTTPASAAESNDQTDKVAKQRSPNYPVIDLEKAVERAGVLHGSYRTQPVNAATAATKLGYKIGSSVSGQVLAAMRAFGLIVAEGSAKERKVKVSEAGEKIILNHSSRPKLLQEAALAPKIHRELWDRFFAGKAAPDPDDLIKHYLQWDRVQGKFNPESIGPLLNQLKRTIKFAKLDSSATISGTAGGDDGEPELEGHDQMQDQQNNLKPPLIPGTREFLFPLIDSVASLRVPHPMGEANYNLLTAVLEAAKTALIGPPKKDEP